MFNFMPDSFILQRRMKLKKKSVIAVGKQSSLGEGGTMNLPECSSQNTSKCTKIFPFFLIGLG